MRVTLLLACSRDRSSFACSLLGGVTWLTKKKSAMMSTTCPDCGWVYPKQATRLSLNTREGLPREPPELESKLKLDYQISIEAHSAASMFSTR